MLYLYFRLRIRFTSFLHKMLLILFIPSCNLISLWIYRLPGFLKRHYKYDAYDIQWFYYFFVLNETVLTFKLAIKQCWYHYSGTDTTTIPARAAITGASNRVRQITVVRRETFLLFLTRMWQEFAWWFHDMILLLRIDNKCACTVMIRMWWAGQIWYIWFIQHIFWEQSYTHWMGKYSFRLRE